MSSPAPESNIVEYVVSSVAAFLGLCALLVRVQDPLKRFLCRILKRGQPNPVEMDFENMLNMDDIRRYCQVEQEHFKKQLRNDLKLLVAEALEDWRDKVIRMDADLRHGQGDLESVRREMRDIRERTDRISNLEGKVDALSTQIQELTRAIKSNGNNHAAG